MDIVSKDDVEPEKRSEDSMMNFQSPNMSTDWQLSGSNLTNASNQMIDSFCASGRDNPTSSSNLGFCGANIQINNGTTNALGSSAISLDSPGASVRRILAMGWTQPNAMLKGGMFASPQS